MPGNMKQFRLIHAKKLPRNAAFETKSDGFLGMMQRFPSRYGKFSEGLQAFQNLQPTIKVVVIAW